MPADFSSEALTRGIRVHVVPTFDPQRSRIDSELWFFLYTVTISNLSDTTVQLLARHWIVTDENGRVEEVRGGGVVGEQPILAPGEEFTYTSGCPLKTPTGSMKGSYRMRTEGGDPFDAVVAPFVLSEPYEVN